MSNVDHVCPPYCAPCWISRLIAERDAAIRERVARLREALREIATRGKDQNPYAPGVPCGWECNDIARAALEGGGST